MLYQVNDTIKKSSRLLVLRNPMSVDIHVYRKRFTRDENDNPDDDLTLGGMMLLGEQDEADFELEFVGEAKMMFLGRIQGSEYAVNNLDYGENDAVCYIEPLNDGEFTVKKQDIIYWLLPNMSKAFQVSSLISPSQMPMSRLAVYHIQPVEDGLYILNDEEIQEFSEIGVNHE